MPNKPTAGPPAPMQSTPDFFPDSPSGTGTPDFIPDSGTAAEPPTSSSPAPATPSQGGFQPIPNAKDLSGHPVASAIKSGSEGFLQSMGVPTQDVLQQPNVTDALKVGIGGGAQNLWRSVVGETKSLQQAMGEKDAYPVIGTPFTDAMIIPHLMARGYETIASGIEEAATKLQAGIAAKDSDQIANAVGYMAGVIGQSRMAEMEDASWKQGAKPQLLNAISKARASANAHFDAISQADMADLARSGAGQGTFNLMSYYNNLLQGMKDRATAPSVNINSAIEGSKLINDMLNRPTSPGNPMLNFDEMSRLRSQVGKELGKAKRMDINEGLRPNESSPNTQLVNELYGAMSKDMQARAGALGMGKSWEAGNGIHSDLHAGLDGTPLGDMLRASTGKEFFDLLEKPGYNAQTYKFLKSLEAYGLDDRFYDLAEETRNLRRMAGGPEPGTPLNKKMGMVYMASMLNMPRPFLAAYSALMARNYVMNAMGDPMRYAAGKLDEMMGAESPQVRPPTAPAKPGSGQFPQGSPQYMGPERRFSNQGPPDDLERRVAESVEKLRPKGWEAQEHTSYDTLRQSHQEKLDKLAAAKQSKGKR